MKGYYKRTGLQMTMALFLTVFAASGAESAPGPERFHQLQESANKDFEAKQFNQAEDKYLGVVAEGLNLRASGDKEIVNELADIYSKLAKCQVLAGRKESAVKTCEQALKNLGGTSSYIRGPIIDELFAIYLDERQWRLAVRTSLRDYSDRLSNKADIYLPRRITAQGDYSLEGARKWFKKESESRCSPELYSDFCKACLDVDADDYLCDKDTKDACVTFLMWQHKYLDALPYLERLLRKDFRLGIGTLGHPAAAPDELASCYRQLGRTAEANQVAAVAMARKNYPDSDFNYAFRQLLKEARDYVHSKQRMPADAKIGALKKMCQELAYAPDKISSAQVMTLEAAAAEQWGDLATARKIYNECLKLNVPYDEKVESAKGISRLSAAKADSK